MGFVIKAGDVRGVASGTHTTVTADDDIDTGLREVFCAIATLSTDPVLTASYATAEIPSQITSPGVISIKTWSPTAANNSAPAAALVFSMDVHWIAFGR